MNIPLLRCCNQQLLNPVFESPREVVSWMGMIQAQDFAAAKRALAIRLKCADPYLALAKVEQALDEGSVIRTHVLRPTWQLVASEDFYWMNSISRQSNERACTSYMKQNGISITEEEFARAHRLIADALKGGVTMTAGQIRQMLSDKGLAESKLPHVTYYLAFAEYRGLICSGRLNANKSTYALAEERISAISSINGSTVVPERQQAIVQLAGRYFQSHSPASLKDFVWWSGLRVTEAKKAIEELPELESFGEYYLYKDSRCRGTLKGQRMLLPAFDEYLVGYANRNDVLDPAFKHLCISRNGMFAPVLLEEGKIVASVKGGKEIQFR